MNTDTITKEHVSAFTDYLKAEEKAEATVEKYKRDVTAFALWLEGETATKETAADYKKRLLGIGRVATGVNAVIAALNSFFSFMGWEIKLKPLKIQRQTFRDKDRELAKAEYSRHILRQHQHTYI